MNLIIDQGNTSTKLAIFKKNELVAKAIYSNINIEDISGFAQRYDIDNVIISTVKGKKEEISNELKDIFKNIFNLDDKLKLPFDIDYKTPSTLGADRIAAMAGAMTEVENQALLVIDAWTAITYDFMDNKKIYHGGNIAPGLTMRFTSLNEYTNLLPLVDKEGDLPMLGDSTITAIRCGVVKGIVYEINGFINEVKTNFPEVFVFLTGGDSNFLAKNINYTNFVDENLVLKGLNRILNYNVEK